MYRLKTSLIRARPIIVTYDTRDKKGTEFEIGMKYYYTLVDGLTGKNLGLMVRQVYIGDYDFKAKKRVYFTWTREFVDLEGTKLDNVGHWRWLKGRKKFGDILKECNELFFGENRYIDDNAISYNEVLNNLKFYELNDRQV